jgi:two-component system, cell cycle sensor histidine kinase and response regulator CckA
LVGNCNIAVGGPIGKPCINVLLVEDNAAEARFLQELLKGAMLSRFHLIHAKRLGEAISWLEPTASDQSANQSADPDGNRRVDLILLDLTLPDSTGLASLDALLHQAPKLPIVVLTNTNDNELAVQAVRHGAQDYLFKRQINQEILVRSIHYAIERKQGAEALREANEALELRVQERTAELKMANELLRQEIEWRQRIQERLELAQQAGKIGPFEWNIQSNGMAWTAELEALYGLDPGGFGGKYNDWIQTLHPDDRLKTEQELWQAVQRGQGLNAEFRILCPDGQTRWIAVKSSLFHDQAGKPLRMIGIHMDITEKKQLEAQFLRAQRLESLGTLASGIAHDLNNILTPILAVAQLLPLKLLHLDEQTQHMLDILESSARRGTGLIRQILSFARGVEGKRGCLQIKHLLLEIQKIIQQTLPKSITISADVPANLWTVSGDVTQLHQVFMNLCVNARDAMPEGGLLEITAENLQIDQSYARRHLDAHPGSYVLITVTDTGVGIPPDILHHIFDPFFTTKELGKGTGLGLSAVLGIIKSHGGFVDVETEVNKGSQFKVYLPASQTATPVVEAGVDPMLGQQEWILIVDDEVFICEATKAMLEAHHYRVLTAHNGVEAIARFAEHKEQIQTVLMDLMMPCMDGLATVSVLRRFNPQLHLIAMSGINTTEMIAQAKQMGFHDFLSKPFTIQELSQSLQSRDWRGSNARPSA